MVCLALLLARLPIQFAALSVLTPILGLALFLRPSLGVYALAFTVPFGSAAAISLAGGSVGPSELVLAAMVAVWSVRMAAARRLSIRVPRVAWWLAIYIGASSLTLLNTVSLTAALPELVKWVEMWLVLILVANLVEPRDRLPICLVLLCAGLVEAALGAYQFLRQVGPEGFVLFGRYMRAYGTFEQPNPYGGYLGLLLPLTYGLVLAYLPGPVRGVQRCGELWLAALGFAVAACLAAGLVMSWSRGALVGMVCGLALVVLLNGRRAWAVGLVLLPLVAFVGPELVALAPAGFVERLLDSLRYMGQDLTQIEVTDDTFALVERAAHWQAAWRMFETRPWLGVGIGQYPVVYPQVAAPRWQDPLGHAHNIYLHFLAEGGLLGLTAHLLFWASWLVTSVSQTWRERGVAKVVGIGALGMLGHLAAHSMVDNLYVHGMYLIMGILLGLMSVANRMHGSPEPSCLSKPTSGVR